VPPLAPPDAPVLARLRAETRADHERLERAVRLTAPDVTPADYRTYLARMYGVHAPLERDVFAAVTATGSSSAAALDLDARRRIPALERDLEALGVNHAALPLHPSLPRADGPAALLGILYVIEGSTLGAAPLRRALRARLPRELALAPAYLAAYGEQTAARWHALRGVIAEEAAKRGQEDALVRAARDTFAALHRWFTAPAG
jgi:heme oxygenase